MTIQYNAVPGRQPGAQIQLDLPVGEHLKEATLATAVKFLCDTQGLGYIGDISIGKEGEKKGVGR